MNLGETLTYLYALGHEMLAMKLGLESMRALCRALGNPQLNYQTVHLAGTNGKGSTAAMTEAIARAAGLRVGLYTSPHLAEITERVRVDGVDIAPDDFARLATEVRSAGEGLVQSGLLPAPPTFFEQVTAIGFLHFAERQVELAVLEVGLGGRLDATNVCEPLACAITPVSLDHQEYLGRTLAEIAGEKAGIIKASVPVVMASQAPEAARVIEARAAQVQAPLVSVDAAENQLVRCEPESLPDIVGVAAPFQAAGLFHFQYRTPQSEYEVHLSLRGEHQVTNACTAIHLAEQLGARGLAITSAAIEQGLGRVRWPGRLELMELGDGTERVWPLLLDGAHNQAGAAALRDFLLEYGDCAPLTLIFGVLADKAIDEMVLRLFPPAQTIIATRVANARSAPPELIAGYAEAAGKRTLIASSAAAALDLARQVTLPGGWICACGSLYLIGEIKKELGVT